MRTLLRLVLDHLSARVVPFLLRVPPFTSATTLILFSRLNHMHAHSRFVLQILVVSVSEYVFVCGTRSWSCTRNKDEHESWSWVGCPATEMLHSVSPWWAQVHLEAWEDRLKSC